ncbi:hypothetical protein PILCRDRAFT_819399 [Piloderma croceum F 1598]|uniref:Uncharacterized protein n=1 Tax=Piloderma croceum (strain F 1598) TaxID=765440 RepID=A0A0C3FFD2_PILCF|nr:hypothetical protein PILCRDRAFT_819399 [Piloderma croceum F 1598]
MIVDSDHNKNMETPQDNPPSYDLATNQDAGPSYGAPKSSGLFSRKDKAHQAAQSQPPSMSAPTIYNYVHPITQEHIASPLPPNHPEMICLQQGHVPQTRYGLLGVLAAVFWFPLGIGLCLLDRHVKCQRCGYIIDKGII